MNIHKTHVLVNTLLEILVVDIHDRWQHINSSKTLRGENSASETQCQSVC